MKTMMKVNIGDWSKDGHNQCDEFIIECNISIEDARQAYMSTCEALGVALHDDHTGKYEHVLFSEYEDNSISKEVMDKLKEAGLKPNEMFDDLLSDDLEETYIECPNECLKLLMWYINRAIPHFEWKHINPPNFNGFWDNEFNHRIGYGLFY